MIKIKHILLFALFSLLYTSYLFPSNAYASAEWQITLRIEAGTGYNRLVLGADETATDGYDNVWEVYALLDGEIQAYFPHPEWNMAQEVFWRDIKAKAVPGMTTEWSFVVDSSKDELGNPSLYNYDFTIRWDLSRIPQNYEIVLIDDSIGKTMNMRSTPSYDFTYTEMRHFKVAVTTPPDVLPDTIPPSTSIIVSGIKGSNGWFISDVTIKLMAADDSSGVKAINYNLNGTNSTASGSNASISPNAEGRHSITYYAEDNAGNEEAEKSININIDRTPPSVIVTAAPSFLWPSNKRMVDVKIDGLVTEETSGLASLIVTVEDEYGIYSMAGPILGSVIQLEAWRKRDDMDGRHYTITAIAIDMAGNQSSAVTEVIVPHDMHEEIRK